MNWLNPYLKFVVSLIGVADTSLAAFYGSQHWYVVVTTAATAVMVYLTPNLPKSPAASADK